MFDYSYVTYKEKELSALNPETSIAFRCKGKLEAVSTSIISGGVFFCSTLDFANGERKFEALRCLSTGDFGEFPNTRPTTDSFSFDEFDCA